MDLLQQVYAILTLVLTVLGAVVTQIFGYKSVNKAVDEKLAKAVLAIHESLKNKVDVTVYAATVKELHESKNALALKLAETEREVKVLNDLVAMVIKRDNSD